MTRSARSLAAAGLLLLLAVNRAAALEPPSCLPRYDLEVNLDVDHHVAKTVQRVTWTNSHTCPAKELVFNAHSTYEVPGDQVGFLAKMLEIMRMMPSEALNLDGPVCHIDAVHLLEPDTGEHGTGVRQAAAPQEKLPAPRKEDALPPPKPVPWVARELPFHFQEDNKTALVVPLPRPVNPGDTVTVEIAFTMKLPEKQGRWGYWKGVTFLTNWNPVLAYFDEKGWQPTPFCPWHLPWFNEAGQYNVRVTLPGDQVVASTGSVCASRDLGNGLKQIDIVCPAARDFALLCSCRYQVYSQQCGPVKVNVCAFPEHEFYARSMLRIVCEALPVFSKWFGPFPYLEFTVAESYFGWNGNQCGDLVMIDERVFGMPHFAENYVDYLVSHETCHQWFYNIIGVNGYGETFMDEAPAVYFTHKLMDIKHGKNNLLLVYPKCLEWLPTIERENYRYYSLYGCIGRGEQCAIVQDMPKFGHVVNLFSMCYDKGSKVLGMIEDRLGEAAFFDFMHILYHKYYFRILRVSDFQHELEEYTHQSWEQFFQDWLYGKGMTDWSIEKVRVEDPEGVAHPLCRHVGAWLHPQPRACRVTVLLHQKAEYDEPTVLGFRQPGCEGYQVRVPIIPAAGHLDIDTPPAQIDTLEDHRVRVTVELPWEPEQIAVDPDKVLVDCDPANNFWKPECRFHFSPLYTFLDETDLTNDYYRWNILLGPWLFFPAYEDPWFTRSIIAGGRAGVYRTQHFSGGVYMGYRTDFQDFVVGADALWDHCLTPHTQLGAIFEQRLYAGLGGDEHPSRAVLFARHVFDYGDSLYLPPMHYAEAFTTAEQNFLPDAKITNPGGQRWDHMTVGGVHYHINYLTPYWDAEGGFQFDLAYAGGDATLDHHESFHEVMAELSYVKCVPDGLGYLSDTRVALHLYGATAVPDKGEFFPLGGPSRFRGFGLSDREGSSIWGGSLEWRAPLIRGVELDLCDHVVGLRNVYLAPFYDVGDCYVSGHSLVGTAHALGCGLRLDLAWFSFIERTILSFDVAKTVNANTPFQFWLGFVQPF